MKLILIAMCATLVVGASGCKKRPKRLVTEAELRVLGDKADTYFRAAQQRICNRAPLRQAAGPSEPADSAIIAVMESKPFSSIGVVAAIRHRNACSPYAPGRRGSVVMRVAELGKHITQRANKLGPARAVTLLLQGLRFIHDLSRGGSLIVAADLAVQCKRLTDAVAAHLAANTLSRAELQRAELWLTALLKTQPSAHVLVQDELHLGLLEHILPLLKHATWTPPGGWPGGVKPPPVTETDDAFIHLFKFERDLHGLRWLALRAEASAAAEVCAPDASLQTCADGLSKMAAEHDAWLTKLGREDLSEVIRTSGKAEVIRSNAVDSLRESVRPDYATSLRDLIAAAQRLDALRSIAAAKLKPSPAKLKPSPAELKPSPAELKPSE